MPSLTPAQLERARKGGLDRVEVIREVRDANVGMTFIAAIKFVDAQLKDPDQFPPHLQAMLDSVAAVEGFCAALRKDITGGYPLRADQLARSIMGHCCDLIRAAGSLERR